MFVMNKTCVKRASNIAEWGARAPVQNKNILAKANSLPILLAMSLLAGCGDKGAETVENNASSVAQSVSQSSATTEQETQARFIETIERHAREFIAQSPETSTRLGLDAQIGGEGYNSRLTNYSFDANQEASTANQANLVDLDAIDRDSLTASMQVTYDILHNAYETAAQRNQFEFGLMRRWGSSSPYRITQLSGVHLELPRVLQTQHPIKTTQDIENYLSRLDQMARVFDEVGQMVRADAATGVVPPAFAINGAAKSIASFTASQPVDNPLVTTLTKKMSALDGMTSDASEAYALRAADILTDRVYPAYARLRTTLLDLLPQSPEGAGIWRIGPAGEDFYQHALDSYGAQGMTGDEVHQLGLDEVARITKQMDMILREEGMTEGTVAARYDTLGQKPSNLYPNTAAGRDILLSDLNDQVAGIMAKSDQWFGTLPEQAVEVRRIPVYEQDSSAGGYYTSPSLDGTRPGIYWINLKNTADWPKFSLNTLTYHEAVPGHHFQISLQQAIEDLPLIRNMMFYSEFSEGWALYAELVAFEMGMYADDPLGDLGRLQSELFRAARLVVDSGLHAKQWTRAQAIDYMVSATGESRAAVTREVERYSVWPGQATSYKLGMLKIVELRKRAEAALGDGFSIKDFHDEVLLTGAMPLGVLEAKIDRWIAAQEGA